MKRRIAFFLLFLLVTVVFAKIEFAQANKEVTIPSTNYTSIEANYLAGINSDNEGLKVNSAYFLGEMKSKKGVVPLMDMFRNNVNESAKLVAAWSLFKIGDARGVFLVKRSIDLGENEGINLMLQHLYKDYVSKSEEAAN